MKYAMTAKLGGGGVGGRAEGGGGGEKRRGKGESAYKKLKRKTINYKPSKSSESA